MRAFSRPAQAISEIVQGSKRITAETALELSAALGTSAEVWLQLDAGYRLRLAEERPETAYDSGAGDRAWPVHHMRRMDILRPMPHETTDVLSTALALPVRERARIAHELLLSLDEGTDADAAQAWVAELEQRASEVRSGEVATEDWATVRSRLADRWHHR